MIAKTPIYEVVAIKKKSKMRLVGETKIGDKIVFEVPIKYPGRGSSGVYASSFIMRNLTTFQNAHFCFYDIQRIEEILELKEIDNG